MCDSKKTSSHLCNKVGKIRANATSMRSTYLNRADITGQNPIIAPVTKLPTIEKRLPFSFSDVVKNAEKKDKEKLELMAKPSLKTEKKTIVLPLGEYYIMIDSRTTNPCAFYPACKAHGSVVRPMADSDKSYSFCYDCFTKTYNNKTGYTCRIGTYDGPFIVDILGTVDQWKTHE
jgi:hypothetical protein